MVATAISERLRTRILKSRYVSPRHCPFFEFADPLRSSPFRLRSRLPAENLPDRKPLDLLTKGKTNVRAPIQFDAVQGEETEDVLWTQLVRPVCVSRKVVELLKENEICGWSIYPVEIYDQEGTIIPDFHGLAVTGPVCKADYERSEVVKRPSPVPRGQGYEVFRGLYFDESQWDGSDMFWVDGVLAVVEKVYFLFKNHNVGNVRFIPLKERETRVRHVRRA